MTVGKLVTAGWPYSAYNVDMLLELTRLPGNITVCAISECISAMVSHLHIASTLATPCGRRRPTNCG